jgi:hypothetical protein
MVGLWIKEADMAKGDKGKPGKPGGKGKPFPFGKGGK